MVYAPDGTLFGVGDSLFTIDDRTGKITLVGGLRENDTSKCILVWGAFFYSGNLYVTSIVTHRIYRVDLPTGHLTFIADEPAWAQDKIFHEGTLYGLGSYCLLVYNPETFDTVRTIRPFYSFFAGFLTNGNGELLGFDDHSSELRVIDPITGKTTKYLELGISDLSCVIRQRP